MRSTSSSAMASHKAFSRCWRRCGVTASTKTAGATVVDIKRRIGLIVRGYTFVGALIEVAIRSKVVALLERTQPTEPRVLFLCLQALSNAQHDARKSPTIQSASHRARAADAAAAAAV